MTPRARQIVERRKQREAEVWARFDAEIAEERRKNPLPVWYPPPRARDYIRDEDLVSINPGESQD